MCQGFSVIVLKDGSIYFTLPDEYGNISHSHIIGQLSIPDNTSPFVRLFVRAEVTVWDDPATFHWDEAGNLPVWMESIEEETKNKIIRLSNKTSSAFLEYKKNFRVLTKKHTESLAELQRIRNLSWDYACLSLSSFDEKQLQWDVIYIKSKKDSYKLLRRHKRDINKIYNKFCQELVKFPECIVEKRKVYKFYEEV